MLQHASSLDKISQHYVLPDKQDQLEFIGYDSPRDTPLNLELPLSAKSSLLQTIFSVRALGKPNYLEARVLVPTHWNLDLLESLLEDYEDKLVVDFLMYGWPMSRSILLLTNGSAKVNHKGHQRPSITIWPLSTLITHCWVLSLPIHFLIEQPLPYLISAQTGFR